MGDPFITFLKYGQVYMRDFGLFFYGTMDKTLIAYLQNSKLTNLPVQ